ncbi:Response regulator containing a CheY-like receiver domain and an HTH DNA-binding domain protein [Legionella jordanis]|uniref:Response regulator containing a CheY-like receiver domain and an HTH DNA-binding domain protein n=2 Tax=Legionella jordanis TaxID=456 RepID=A0A0W0VBK9_9GAMM|nr:Response regulator containing a CheY-like receiver domain and an HTH DNA-binding domain protein [Legionella jordanis]VEH12548.1 Response regulator containing a CheY-like receiver domain and an HTH DNA-binding domain [Legionella jordanis]
MWVMDRKNSEQAVNPQNLINYTDYINQTCKSLFKLLGINHFSYVEINCDGEFFWLGSNSQYLERCIHQQLVDEAPVSILKTYPKSGFYLIDAYQEEYKAHSLPVFELLNDFEYGHSFRILEVDNQRTVKLYSFEAPLQRPDINQIYLNNLDVFKRFNMYFENKLSFIREGIHKNYIANSRHSEFLDLLNAPIQQNNRIVCEWENEFHNENEVQITPREKEILMWYLKGKTAEETARLLKISRRTIERHFENLREKLGCFSKNQIALKLLRLI